MAEVISQDQEHGGKFRVLIGVHLDNGPEGCKCHGCQTSGGKNHIYRARNERGDPRRGELPDGADYKGDIVESKVDLARRFNAGPNSMKFERLDERLFAPQATSQPPATKLPHNPAKYRAALEKMNVRELQAHAADEDVDLKGVKDKDGIIKALLGA